MKKNNILLLSLLVTSFSLCITSCTQQEENEIFAEEYKSQIKDVAKVGCTTTPGETLERIENPRDFGFDPEKLESVEQLARQLDTDALLVSKCGKILVEFGTPATKRPINSMRKPFMGAVYEKYVADGTIDLNKTLGQYGINDVDGLSQLELSATLNDVIRHRSGVYHTSLFETPKMKATKPPRDSKVPGEFFYYNNFDANVLYTIFVNETGERFFRALNNDILTPIGVKGFNTSDGRLITGQESDHPVYALNMNAFTLLRFGILLSREGDWGGEQVLSRNWVREMTRYHSNAAIYDRGGFGKFGIWNGKEENEFPHFPNVDMPQNSYHAFGFGGQYIIVDNENDLVVVHQVRRNREVSHADMGRLLNLIFEARIEE